MLSIDFNMKIFKYMIIIIIMMEACDKPKNKTALILNSDFFQIIDTYTKKHPLKSCFHNINTKKISYPSYNIYFNKVDNDTVMSIIKAPYIYNFELDGTHSVDNKDIIFYKNIKPDGVIWYNDKCPLVLFNCKLYAKENLMRYLTQDIPDSLEFNQSGCHFKPNRKDYIIKHKKIIEKP